MNYFQPVTFIDLGRQIGRPRHNFEILFHGHLAAVQSQILDKRRQIGGRNLPFFAIQQNFHHFYAIFRRN